MKNILVIGLTPKMGGVETFIYNTTIYSNKEKYEYYYLVHGAKNCVFSDEIYKFYGCKHIEFINRFKDNLFLCMLEIFQYYKKNRKMIDCIHLETGSTTEILYVFPFNFIYHIPVIVHSHNGNGKHPYVNRLFTPIVNLCAKKKLACSSIAAKWLFGNKKSKNVKIVNNGIDIEKFSFNYTKRLTIRRQYGIEEEFVVGHIGRFSDQKNHIFLLKIFKNILKTKDTAKLMLVGEGINEEIIKNKSKELGVENAVIFAGMQMEVNAFYFAFDVFVMPSLYEGLPIVGIEAQCAGLECFFSNTIDRQILITSRAHMLSLNSGSEQWAERIIRVNCDYDRTLIAMEVKEAGYDIKSITKYLGDLYASV